MKNGCIHQEMNLPGDTGLEVEAENEEADPDHHVGIKVAVEDLGIDQRQATMHITTNTIRNMGGVGVSHTIATHRIKWA